MEDDGFYLPEIGAHSLDKIKRHDYYASIFSKAMAQKWTHRVYLGLYAGAGLRRVLENRPPPDREARLDGRPLDLGRRVPHQTLGAIAHLLEHDDVVIGALGTAFSHQDAGWLLGLWRELTPVIQVRNDAGPRRGRGPGARLGAAAPCPGDRGGGAAGAGGAGEGAGVTAPQHPARPDVRPADR